MKKLIVTIIAGTMTIGTMGHVQAAQKLPKTLSQKEINMAISRTKNYSGKEHVYVAVNGRVHVTNKKEKGTEYWYDANNRASVTRSKAGVALVKGLTKGSTTLTQVFYKKAKSAKVANKEFNGEKLAFNYSSLTLNLNEQATVKTNKSTTLVSSRPDVVRVGTDGKLTCLKNGTSVIKATHTEKAKDTNDQQDIVENATLKVKVVGHVLKKYSVKATVSQPKLDNTIVYCVPNNFRIVKLPISGVSKQSRKRIYVDTKGVNEKAKYPAICSLQGKIITAPSAQGKLRIRYAVNSTCKIYVDGLVLKRHIIISKLKFDSLEDTILLPHQKAHFSMKGMSGKTEVTITPHNTAAVSMNKSHIVTAHKPGKMSITIKGDGITYTRQYWCVDQRTYNVVKAAYAIAKTKPHFSLNRTGNTIDCSTFIWRVYKKNGINFGSSSAPVASNIAKYCQSHGRLTKAPKTIHSLRPGDLMFISSHKNGRFKNITHVEMYISSGTDLGARGPSTTPYLKNAYGQVVEGDAISDTLIAVGHMNL
jgi:hypothetical protein